MFILTLAILFFIQVPLVFGQWLVHELNCYPDYGCWDQEINVPVLVNFRVTFTDLGFLVRIQGAGWAYTEATCPNGASVQTNAMLNNHLFFVGYDHWSDELNGFNRILMTLEEGTFQPNIWGSLQYTPATVLYFPELCSPPPPHPGGYLSRFTTSGEKFEDGDSADLCSPCNPSQYELDMCWQSGGTYDWAWCQCGHSPIVIDVLGNGFNLTNAENGIQFDINGDGTQEQIAWSAMNSDDAWLALDRNSNGLIDNGRELFGNSTQQPAPPAGEIKNGFLALAVFDKITNGGNNDGKINRLDAVFNNLRLWQDLNHNGISETNELKILTEVGLAKIELDYRESRRRDEHGNRFRFRAKVRDTQDAQLGRWAWDVYLVVRFSNN